MYPIVGYITGAISALPALVAVVTMATVLLRADANHFDGLMAHGSREKRIAAMTDRTTGILVTLLASAGLAPLPVWIIGIGILTVEVWDVPTHEKISRT